MWAPSIAPARSLLIYVDLSKQRTTVYRNGVRIAVSTVYSSKEGHETPTGTCPILQKDVSHKSGLYRSAAMPSAASTALPAPAAPAPAAIAARVGQLVRDASGSRVGAVSKVYGDGLVQVIYNFSTRHPSRLDPVGAGWEIIDIAHPRAARAALIPSGTPRIICVPNRPPRPPRSRRG